MADFVSVANILMLPMEAREPGTYVSDVISDNPNFWVTEIGLWVHITDIVGALNLDVSLEQSTDKITWTAVPGSNTPPLSSVGNAFANAHIGTESNYYTRVTSTVSGDPADLSAIIYRVLTTVSTD